MDTGDIVTQEATPIEPTDNAQTLHDRLARLGAALLVKTIPEYVAGKIQPRPQPPEGVTHAAKIRKQDGQLDWNGSATSIWNRVRALVPWPGAFSHLATESHPLLLKIWDVTPVEGRGTPGEILQADRSGILVACGSGAVRITILQREGGRRLNAQEFLAGSPLKPGHRFVTANA